jgi:hypothetical protein
MATYYVSQSTGSNSNNGTNPSTPWSTLAFALGAASGTNPGLVGGDIVYVAPGSYNEAVTIGFTSPSSTVQIIGDPLNAQGFPNVSGGIVQWWNSSAPLTATSKNNISLSNMYLERLKTSANYTINCTTCYGWTLSKCVVTTGARFTVAAQTALNLTVSRCVLDSIQNIDSLLISAAYGTDYNINLSVSDCLFIQTGVSGGGVGLRVSDGHGNGGTVSNCTFQHSNNNVQNQSLNVTNKLMIQNSLFLSNAYFINPAGSINAQYNRYTYALGTNGVSGTGSTLGGQIGLDYGNARQFGYGLNDFWGSNAGAANIGFGTSSGAPSVDLYGVTWLGNPDAGAVQRSSLSNFQPPTAPYVAAERNASTITIAPGSTSQSIEIYLGATGLTVSTSGLSARYNRTRTASVSIPLVARTIAQAWTAGGFAEVDATNMPGVYRLDLPDAALASGADDVTIVVRGASGTNGAVMTVKLSSGGLTSAQTASAVWGASPAGYNDATTFGGVVNQTDSVVNGIDTQVQDVPSQVWDQTRATHTTAGTFGEYVNTNINTGAIADAVWDEARSGHTTVGTFGQYVNAELVTPVTSAALVRMGPFEVRADGLGASDPLDIQKGAQHGIDIQCVDNNGAGIDITSATVTAKVYNSGATLVDTYSCTATYAADGRAQFTIDTTVTNVPGTYTATITRTTGASDTQVFGLLRIYVRDI